MLSRKIDESRWRWIKHILTTFERFHVVFGIMEIIKKAEENKRHLGGRQNGKCCYRPQWSRTTQITFSLFLKLNLSDLSFLYSALFPSGTNNAIRLLSVWLRRCLFTLRQSMRIIFYSMQHFSYFLLFHEDKQFHAPKYLLLKTQVCCSRCSTTYARGKSFSLLIFV